MVGQWVRTVYRLYVGAEFEWSLNADQSCCKVVVLGTQGLGLGFSLCVVPLPVKLMSRISQLGQRLCQQVGDRTRDNRGRELIE